MAIEQQLFDTLKVLCPRTFPDFAPVSTVRPYITYQQIGGKSLRFLDNTAADKRHVEMQVNVWGNSRMETTALARQIEDALCASPLFVATPNSEPASDFDADIPVFGTRQDFSIYATR